MTLEERQYYISRMSFCQAFFVWHHRDFYVRFPDMREQFMGAQIYRQALMDCNDCPSNDDVLIMMVQLGYWNMDQQRELDGFYDNLDKLKISLYDSRLQSETSKIIKKSIVLTRNHIDRLESLRNRFRYISRESIALQAKLQYIVGACICKEDGSSKLQKDFWKRGIHPIVGFALNQVTASHLNEIQLRELARNEPWTSIWHSQEMTDGLFGLKSSQLNDEQRALIMWSRAYDNARSSDEMSDEIINDDDLFDGWMLKQNKEIKRKQDAAWLESKLGQSKNVRKHEHLFVMTETPEDARRAFELNDARGKMEYKQLMIDTGRKETTLDQETSFGQNKMREAWAKMNNASASRIRSGK